MFYNTLVHKIYLLFLAIALFAFLILLGGEGLFLWIVFIPALILPLLFRKFSLRLLAFAVFGVASTMWIMNVLPMNDFNILEPIGLMMSILSITFVVSHFILNFLEKLSVTRQKDAVITLILLIVVACIFCWFNYKDSVKRYEAETEQTREDCRRGQKTQADYDYCIKTRDLHYLPAYFR